MKAVTQTITKRYSKISNPHVWFGTYEREGDDIDRFVEAFGRVGVERQIPTNRKIKAFVLKDERVVPVFEN